MSKSIIQDTKECYITGAVSGLHKHHIFEGPDRKLSEHYGLWVWLRYDWHNGASYGVHFNKELDRKLKVLAQERFEEIHGHDKFMQIFRKNYLD